MSAPIHLVLMDFKVKVAPLFHPWGRHVLAGQPDIYATLKLKVDHSNHQCSEKKTAEDITEVQRQGD